MDIISCFTFDGFYELYASCQPKSFKPAANKILRNTKPVSKVIY